MPDPPPCLYDHMFGTEKEKLISQRFGNLLNRNVHSKEVRSHNGRILEFKSEYFLMFWCWLMKNQSIVLWLQFCRAKNVERGGSNTPR